MLLRLIRSVLENLRLPAMITLLLSAVMVAVILIAQVLQSDEQCLVVEAGARHFIDPRVGVDVLDNAEVRGTRRDHMLMNANPPQQTDHFAYAYSPDGLHKAQFSAARQDAFTVTPLDYDPLSVDKQDDYLNDPFITDIQWSPDGSLIALLWREGDANAADIGIADRAGTILGSRRFLTSDAERIQLESWSADGKYLSIINTGDPDALYILHVPGLESVEEIPQGQEGRFKLRGPQFR
jgi:hypothetical protein